MVVFVDVAVSVAAACQSPTRLTGAIAGFGPTHGKDQEVSLCPQHP